MPLQLKRKCDRLVPQKTNKIKRSLLRLLTFRLNEQDPIIYLVEYSINIISI